MNQTELLTFLNKASREELTTLPGIGPALVDRLTAARPFDSLEAVKTVKGIGENLLEKLMEAPASQPDPGPAPETQPVDEASVESRLDDIKETLAEKGQAARAALSEGISDLGESVSKRGQTARQAVEALPEKFEQATQSRGPLWTTMVSSAVTALVAILLTLVVLIGINGSLKFATGSQYRTMQREVSQVSTQVTTLQQDLEGLRNRVDTLESLGERTVALEKAQEQLTADLKAASQQVTAMQAKVDTLNEQVNQQEERTRRFETFLQDLKTLLENLFAPQGGTE